MYLLLLMLQTPAANNSPKTVSLPATFDSTSYKRSSPINTVLSHAVIPSVCPSVTPLAANTASELASPMEVDGPGANNAAASTPYAVKHRTQEHVQTGRGRRSQSSSRVKPSSLGVNMSAEPPASGALAQGQLTTDPAIAALVSTGQVINQVFSATAPLSTGIAVPAVPVASNLFETVPLGPINYTAAGPAAAEAAFQPDVLQVLSILAPRMDSIDAAIAFMIANAGGLAAAGVLPVAGVPGQVPAHIQW